MLPYELDAAAGELLRASLNAAGLKVETLEAPPNSKRCDAHPQLSADYRCGTCGRSTCPLCVDKRGEPFCQACAQALRRRVFWQRVRLVPLVAVLVAATFFAASARRAKAAGPSWTKPVRVGLILLSTRPITPQVRSAWIRGARDIEQWLAQEAQRYALPLSNPVSVRVLGETLVRELPEPPRTQESWFQTQRAAWEFRRLLEAQSDPAADVDVQLMVALSPPGGRGERFVEGAAEAGGRLGLVQGHDAEQDLSLELITTAHELLHFFGAVDAYDAAGHSLEPQGLANPNASPRYPQTHAEVMVGEVADGPGKGHVPLSLDQVRVGPHTAKAIKWVRE